MNTSLIQKFRKLFSQGAGSFKSGKQSSSIILYTGYLKGLSRCSLENIYHLLSRSTRVTLKREPDNRFDSNAISVWYRNHKIGYIACSDNSILSKLMDGYFEFRCEIDEIMKEKFLPPSGIRISVSRSHDRRSTNDNSH